VDGDAEPDAEAETPPDGDEEIEAEEDGDLENEGDDAEEEEEITYEEGLPPRQREVLQMRAFGDMSFAEIADSIGISVSAAKVNYHYAVKALKNLLVNYGETSA